MLPVDRQVKTEVPVDTFSRQFGLPLSSDPVCNGAKPCFQKVHASGKKPKANCGWAQEAALDIEWAHAMAPSAQIVLAEADSSRFTDLFKAVDVATNIVRNGGMAAGRVSMSWGGSEFSSEVNEDSHFAANGVVYFAASGDIRLYCNGRGEQIGQKEWEKCLAAARGAPFGTRRDVRSPTPYASVNEARTNHLQRV